MGRVWREADPARERERESERKREREERERGKSRSVSLQLQRTRNLRPKHRTKTRDTGPKHGTNNITISSSGQKPTETFFLAFLAFFFFFYCGGLFVCLCFRNLILGFSLSN
jgi:hypothetical protein